MDILSPDDLKVGNEYIIETQPGFTNNETDDIMESIVKYNGTYTYVKTSIKSSSYSNKMLVYEFMNTRVCRVQLLYNSNSKKFYGYFGKINVIYCGISEPTSEYVLK